MQKKRSKRQHIITVVMGVIFVLACGGNELVTATIAPPTNTPCPEVTWIPPVEQKPVFYFFLIDGTALYSQTKHISDTKNVLNISLSKLINTGDKVLLGWINDNTQYYGIEKNIFYNDTFFVDAESFSVSPTPTFPPTLSPFDTPTTTPVSVGQLRQTEVAKTVDAAKQIEQESIQRAVKEYLCQKQQTVAEIEDINQLVEAIKNKSVTEFVTNILDRFPSDEQFKEESSNPVFESLATTTGFINQECNLSVYSNCFLIIFSDLEDFRYRLPTNEVPISNMANKIDIVAVIYDCQFTTGCSAKLNSWSGHFSTFGARGFSHILNRDSDKAYYIETIADDFVLQINTIKNQK